ncbi:uncharacterized protein LOC130216624 [Danio aesculapii]|uniref:uncharacterized protein LOC130216624 n=1 Tax=Danio aesculapii TaxID=1142201 RepID=UPI0024BFB553|nr:uncharacterized protein LOC130216624 [Danio aesculapii]
MCRTSIFFQILLLMCCVFGADVDEKRSVMEGDSVTLNLDQDIHGIILVQWKFGDKGSTIAEIDRNKISYPELNELFRGRLKLNQTGSLSIINIRTKHSGLYKVQIDHRGLPLKRSFKVDVCEVPSVIKAHKAEMNSMSVTKGTSAVLQTDVTELHGDELIVWRFGDEGKLLAKEDKETKNPPYYNTDERFRHRLELNDVTGSLTIKKMKDTDAGLYTVKINSNEQIAYKKFIVTVKEHVQRGESVTLEPDTEIERDDEIQWTFGEKDELIAKMGKMTGETREITYPGEGFRDRLKLDQKTGSLTIRNITIKHTGDFKVKISNWRKITKTKNFSIIIKAETKCVQ